MHKKLASADSQTKEVVRVKLIMSANIIVRAPDGSELYFWDEIRWYEDSPEDYPEIKFFQDLFDELPPNQYLFIRIGEDFDDTVIRGSFYGNPFGMELSRHINFSNLRFRGPENDCSWGIWET